MGDIRRLDLGYFIRPAQEAGPPRPGAEPEPRVEPVLGYLVRRPEGLLLFDTGMGRHPAVDAHYRPYRLAVEDALTRAGLSTKDITMVVNCHLHFDHAGGNPLFAGVPILVQRPELELARQQDHTLPELVDFGGVRYEELTGETEVWPDVWIVPTPGHTAGHQSLAVRQPDGTVILAGQAHDFAAGFGGAVLARRAARDGAAQPLPPYPEWTQRLLDFDPHQVLFAHDNSVWQPAGS